MADWIAALATAAGSIVAVAALIIAYGQTVGWKPLLVVKRWGLVELKTGVCTTTAFEVWNRRQYPIVVRRMRIDYNRVKMSELKNITKGDTAPEWQIVSGDLHHLNEFIIGPGENRAFKVDALCIEDGDFPDEEARRISVKLLCFDPFRQKKFVLDETGRDWADHHQSF